METPPMMTKTVMDRAKSHVRNRKSDDSLESCFTRLVTQQTDLALSFDDFRQVWQSVEDEAKAKPDEPTPEAPAGDAAAEDGKPAGKPKKPSR
jgi:hypothetical protein